MHLLNAGPRQLACAHRRIASTLGVNKDGYSPPGQTFLCWPKTEWLSHGTGRGGDAKDLPAATVAWLCFAPIANLFYFSIRDLSPADRRLAPSAARHALAVRQRRSRWHALPTSVQSNLFSWNNRGRSAVLAPPLSCGALPSSASRPFSCSAPHRPRRQALRRQVPPRNGFAWPGPSALSCSCRVSAAVHPVVPSSSRSISAEFLIVA